MTYLYVKQCPACQQYREKEVISEDKFLLTDWQKESDLGFDIQSVKTRPDENGLYEMNNWVINHSPCEMHDSED